MDYSHAFKIGELSKLYNISVDSIRYYEEVGILSPIRNPENNYRLYTMEDVTKLVLIRELLSLNFSTDQIREFYDNRNLAQTRKLLEEELLCVEKSIEDLKQKRQSIKGRLESLIIPRADEISNEVQVLHLPERHCQMVSNENIPDEYVDFYLIRYIHENHVKVDTIGACDCYTLDLSNSNPASLYLRTKNVFFYSKEPLYQTNYILPTGTYLSIKYQGSLTQTKKLMPKLFDYAREHHYTVEGDPIEFCLIDGYETDDESEYLTEIQLPVSKEC